MFDDSFCVIQDCTSRILIGTDNVQGGVFLPKIVSDLKEQAFTVKTSELCHERRAKFWPIC